MEESKAIQAQRARVQTLWVKACCYDNIHVTASFAIFSRDNPFAFLANKEVGILQDLLMAEQTAAKRRQYVDV